jgi:tetratricopeptide (TPR) repeat protein
MNAISKILVFLMLCGSTVAANAIWSQDNFNLPHNEHRPYYQLNEYPRGYDKDSMQLALEQILKKPAVSWSKTDSLDYLFTLIAVSDYDKAHEFFKKFKKVNPRNLDEFHLIQFMFSYKRMLAKAFLWLERERKEYPETEQIIDFRWRLHEVEDLVVRGLWTDDSVLYPVLKDSKWNAIKKGSESYTVQTIPLIQNLDQALRDETKFEFNSNRALAMAFYEFGIFLEKNLSTTDAFIALSIAKYYDRFNSKITEKYRLVRSSMNKKNLIFPSMRELFPKQNKGIFNIENIKKRQQAEQDSIVQIEQKPMRLDLEKEQKSQYLSGKLASLIILIGLVFMLVLVAIFVKIKK